MSLPSGYTQLAYISSTAAQYIDTGFKANQNTKASVTYQCDLTSGNLGLLAADTAWGSSGFGVWGHAAEFGSATTSFAAVTTKRTVILDKGVLQFDGVTSTTLSGGTFTTANNLTIAALNRSGAIQENISAKFYSVEIYDDGVLVRNFVPCTNGAGVVGMYDTVGEKFYSSATSTPFVAGPRVGKVRLEYIEGTGTQRINTGLVVNDTDTYKYEILANFTNDGWGGADGYLQFKGSVAQNRLAWITVNYNGSTKAETVFVDGVQQSSSDWSTLGYSNVLIEIFAMGAKNNVAGTYTVQTGKVYACKITKGSTLVRDYIPYEVDGEAGLWDNVTQTFYTNAGTGSFAGGPVAEYKQVPFIQSTGSQYINTGFMPNQNTRVIMNAQLTVAPGSGDNPCFFGVSSGTTYYRVIKGSSTMALNYEYGTVYSLAWSMTSDTFTKKMVIDANGAICTIDNEKKSYAAQTFQFSYPLYLLAANTAGTAEYFAPARIYSCQIYNNGSLVRDLVPAVRSDGVPGLLDLQNDVFYTNSGSGTFVVGGLDYTPLEYISSFGSQYIDTGFLPTQSTRTVVRYQSTQSSGNQAAFGVRSERSGKGYLYYYEGTNRQMMYGTSYFQLGTVDRELTDVDANGATRTVTVNGSDYTLGSVTFANTLSMYLFAFHEYDGSVNLLGSMRLYGCKIYDDTGGLALDFVPALCETGAVGLVDKLTGSFYGNSGTGAFAAGPEAVYTKVDYIQSSGTQYIDTRFIPDSNTRVTYDFQVDTAPSATLKIFAARTSSTYQFCFAIVSNSGYRTDYGNTRVSISGVGSVGRHFVDKNKNVTTLDGVAVTNTAQTFSTGYTLVLFGQNDSGTVNELTSYKLYGCKVYDNGTLVRDFVPVVRSDGTAGLLDQVDEFFYANSGTGTFVAGPVTKYAKVEYIESNGTQYVDTGYKPNQNTRVSMDCQASALDSGGTFPFGVRAALNSKAFAVALTPAQAFYNYATLYAFVDYANPLERMVIDAQQSVATFTGTTSATVTLSSANFVCDTNLLLATASQGGVAYSGATAWNGKIFACQIYDNGTLVRDFVPVVRSDGTAGLYDQLNDVFYTNSGTGTFVVGPDLDYTKLEYIESTGTQYIDTGFKPNQDTRVLIDIEPINTGKTTANGLYGSRDSTSAAAFAAFSRPSSSYLDFVLKYGTGTANIDPPNGTVYERFLIDHNKNVVTINATETVMSENAFSGSYNLFLMAVNTGGSLDSQRDANQLYFCQIYDDGTLARNYIPALRENGQIGLIDLVSGLFYANAGSGVFIAGPEIVDPDPPDPPGPYEPPSFTEQTLAYLAALRYPFYKLCRLRFLQPDGSTAFSLDNNPKNRRSGAFIADGSISANLQNGKRRNATVMLSNLDSSFDYNVNTVWFGTEIAIDEGLILPDGSEYYIQQGVFAIENPSEAVEPANRTATYNLVDKWSYLDGTLFGNLESTYEVPVGTNIFQPIQAILALDRGNGQPVDGVTPIFTEYYNSKTQALPSGTVVSLIDAPYTLRIDSDSGTFADVLLGLAAMVNAWIGYDQTGALRIDPSQDDILDTNKPILWQFSMDEATLLGANYTVRNVDVYNDYIVLGELLDDNSQPAGRATNLDPRSDTNVQTIGRKTFRMSAPGFATDQQCQDLAVWKLKRSTSLQKAITISCSQLFHIEENGLVTIVRTDKPGSPVERHLVMGFTRPLTSNGEMQINAVSVQDFVTATVTSWPE